MSNETTNQGAEHMSTESRYSTIEVIENGIETHYTLQKAWNEFKTKDPVDSVHNAKMLVAACEERLRALGITL